MPNIRQAPRSAHLVEAANTKRLDVLGPTIELLTSLAGEASDPCIMRGTIPPGGIVPLHSHADPEIFIMQSGDLDGLSQSPEGFRWVRIRRGDIFYVPGHAKHGFRNPSSEPAVSTIITTVKLGRFFERIGVAIVGTGGPAPFSTDRLKCFLQISEEFGYWNASPDENAEAGLSLPMPVT